MKTIETRDARGRVVASDITGLRSGKLKALHPTEERCPNGYTIWVAECECGETVRRPSYWFKRGLIKSCGCGPKGRPRVPNNGAHINAIFNTYKTSARGRRLAFELSREDVRSLVTQDCAYCGSPPELKTTHVNISGEFAWNGIDRADPGIGYTRPNTVPCCSRCNFAKGSMTGQEFRDWVVRVYRHMNHSGGPS